MKSLIVLLITAMTLMLGGKAEAGTFNALLTPDNAVAYVGYPSFHGCGGETWNPTDTAHGFCYRYYTTACSGRGCQQTQYHEYFDVNWNPDGSVLSSVSCGTRKHHNPQTDVWAYSFGYDNTNCRAPILTSAQTVSIDGYTYYDFGVSPSGLYDLIRGNAGPFSYQY